ncbi:hypothetical protein [Halalkalibacter flavus]|uniref:hypothetical protein n=1 Tax=Halalkalibacter flavus TaxID=3090668 RepID=UPI002FC7FCBF
MSKNCFKSSNVAYLSNLIDYAGLFPPAQLPLERAIQNYATYKSYEDSWMLGRFVIPATRLDELDSYVSLFSVEKRLNISAIGGRSMGFDDCLHGLEVDLRKLANFCAKHGEAVGIDVFEMPLPSILPNQKLLEEIATETANYNLQTFCEMTMPLGEEWEENMLKTLDEIAQYNLKNGPVLGVKLRTGGVTADAFPTPEQVAAVLVGCSERSIPQKFTAGLHHPIRMYREEVKTKMHGFLNVFTAGMLARIHKLDKATIAKVLADEEASNFTFTNKGFTWRDMKVQDSDIEQLRRKALCSYGSCSFDEPREDLRTLQLI